MKKRTIILGIFIFAVLVLLAVCIGLKTNKDKSPLNQGDKRAELSSDSETSQEEDDSEEPDSVNSAPQDDVTLDYSGVSDSGELQDETEDKTETPNEKEEEISSSSASGTPYDRDGDGYVDGWY